MSHQTDDARDPTTLDGHDRIRSVVHNALEDPDSAFPALLYLFDALEHENGSVRIAAAMALCLIAEGRPDDAQFIYERTADRESFAALCSANWILKHHSSDDWYEEKEDPERRRNDAEGRPDVVHAGARSGNPSFSGKGPSISSSSPRETERDRRKGKLRRDERRTETDDGEESSTGEEESGADEPSDETSTEGGRTRSSKPTGARSVGRRVKRWDGGHGPQPEREDELVDDDAFAVDFELTEDVLLRTPELVYSDGYSWTYLAMGTIRGRTRPVLARAYVPPENVSGLRFAREFADAMERWEAIDGDGGIATVFDWETEPDPWVVTDLATDTLWSFGRLRPRAAYRCGLTLATALARAHANGVVHGSLSPHTVFFDRTGDELSVRIADFGVGTALRDAGGPLPLQPTYAAPELVRDDYGSLDWMTDVYQLGLILYSMFTGRTPNRYADSDRAAVPNPTDVVDGLPPETDRIVSKATAEHKIARYESAEELARDLQTTLEGDPFGR